MSHLSKGLDYSRRRATRLGAAGTLLCLAVWLTTATATGSDASAGSTDCAKPTWTASWAMPVSAATDGYENQTLRVVAKPNFGGGSVRVRLSNALGTQPLQLADVHVGTVKSGAELIPGSSTPLTFAGKQKVAIPTGGSVLSDPAEFGVEAFHPMAVSFYAPRATGPATGHTVGPTTYVASGDKAADERGDGFGSATSGASFLTAVDVLAPSDGVIVALGDSITEGFSRESLLGDHRPYTDTLAVRLHELAANGGPRLSVVNVGIGGNEVLEDGTGPSAVARLKRDVLSQSGLAGLVMMEGVNDLASEVGSADFDPPAVNEMATGYQDIVARVRATGAAIWISPLAPGGDLKRPSVYTHSMTPTQVARRHEINRWIRGYSGAYNGRFDFETVILDPQFPNWIKTEYDSGDNVHPNNAGLAAMGKSIDLTIFDRFKCGAGS